MPLTKFSKGDRVKVRGNLYYGHTDGRDIHIGKKGRIVEAPDNDVSGLFMRRSYVVQLDDGGSGRWTYEELEAVTAPDPLKYGMSPAGLADSVDAFIDQCCGRVLGVGADQYSNGQSQRFEDATPLAILEMAREEVQDLAVYAAMTDIRLQRVIAALKGRTEIEEAS